MQQLPIAEIERNGVVDALRGFALLGVLLANLISFVSFTMPQVVIDRATEGTLNHYYELFMRIFIDNKFVTLFSLLFGYGFGVLMDRVTSKGLDAVPFYIRRMTILFALGFIHIFFWWGEILHVYAFCGLLMLLFRNASNRSLLIWAVFLMLVPYLIVRYIMVQIKAFDHEISEVVYQHYLDLALQPDLKSVWLANWSIHQYVYVQCIFEWIELTQALAKFLIGYWIMRVGVLNNIDRNVSVIRQVLYFSAAIALAYIIETAWYFVTSPKIDSIILKMSLQGFNRIGVLSLSLTYAGLITLWYRRKPGAFLLVAFRNVGMMSLTNYLCHTLIYVTLLHGIGLGLMDKLTVTQTLYVGLLIYPVQVVISMYWLKRYRYGPVEWIWRQLSYWKRFPIKKRA
ncbi:DUF418 domain-containing protein [Chryseolinea sp. T2]|uniref:DUF418 domain-containing protein n=1 Tax=Chryseolinea sp. T2 TaxID=3129255 RepID=UPI00307710AF